MSLRVHSEHSYGTKRDSSHEASEARVETDYNRSDHIYSADAEREDEQAVEAAVRAVHEHFGRPADVIVNSAGIMGPVADLLDLDVKELRNAYRINVEVPRGHGASRAEQQSK